MSERGLYGDWPLGSGLPVAADHDELASHLQRLLGDIDVAEGVLLPTGGGTRADPGQSHVDPGMDRSFPELISDRKGGMNTASQKNWKEKL